MKGHVFMTLNIQREISRNVPSDIPIRVSDSTVPLLTAYGCVLIERDTGKNYIYTAVNLKNGNREVINKRSSPLTTSGVEAMVEKIRLSDVAGAGRLEADRPFGEKVALEHCHEILTAVFQDALPHNGYKIRNEQISLADNMLDAISRRQIFLAEAEVGTGKTFAYLFAAAIAKRSRLNGYWNMSYYTGSPYVEAAHMPIVIATSSIALQRALMMDYIPEVSRILLEWGIINKPLTAVMRKGREHYICEQKLRNHLAHEQNSTTRGILESLLKPRAPIDLAEVDGLNAYTKRKISVPDRCSKSCPHREKCLYLRFREQAQSPDIDIQVCNHNYLLADILRRTDGQRPLIPNYQMVIIDEGHKFLQAARSMYGVELSVHSLLGINDLAQNLKFKNEIEQRIIRRSASTLIDQGCRLFRRLEELAKSEDYDDERTRFTAIIDDDAVRNLRNIRDVSGRLIELITAEPLAGSGAGRKSQLIWELEQVRNQATILTQHSGNINWLEMEGQDCRLCAIPKNLDTRLYNDFWNKGVPIILTSGTLSAAGDFSHIKRSLGIEHVERKSRYRIVETSKPSPFDYRKNALFYISENVPFPNQNDNDYILSVANEIEQLVYASHGHAAVLFTSYKAMDMVWEHLEDIGLPFPLFRLDKGGIREIERFKNSGNGILFAAGSMWEGIDIPGDALSMLIIVKLPFAVPDPISEYEQTLYRDIGEYKELVIKPGMMIKLKQGVGRPIRTESDTAAIAFLDSRMNALGWYREYVLAGLPDCRITDDIHIVEYFFRDVKSEEYYS